MATLNFPSNPSVGDTWSIGSRTWKWNGSGWALQSGIISTNPFIVVSAQITTTTNSTSTTSGALIVAGGGGFGGTIYAADMYSANAKVITTATIGNFGLSAVQAGTDTAVASLPGNIALVWNTSTLQTVTGRGATTTNAIYINNTAIASSTSSGALKVEGGVGVGGSVFAGGNLNVAGTINVGSTYSVGSYTNAFYINTYGIFDEAASNNQIFQLVTNVTSSTGGTLTGAAGGGIWTGGGGAQVYSSADLSFSMGRTIKQGNYPTGGTNATNRNIVFSSTGSVTINSTDASGSSNTGALVVKGGVGIAGNLNVGGVTYVSGAQASGIFTITNATGASTTTDGALVVVGGVGIGQNVWVGGTLNVVGKTVFTDSVTFSGTATYVLSTNTVYTDNMLELHTTSTVATEWGFDDGKDIGLRFHYYNRTLAAGTNAALVLANDSQSLEWYSSGAEGGNVFTGAIYGTFKTGSIKLVDTALNNQNTNTGALQVAGGVAIQGNQFIGGFGSVASNLTVDRQTLRVNANGIGVNGNSYFADSLGVGTNFSVTGVSTLTSVFVSSNLNAFSLGVTGGFSVTGTTVLSGITQIPNLTDSAGTGSGALQVAGGVGIGGSVNIGGDIFVQGIINATVVGSISTATNIAGGIIGAIPYQTAFGRTSFINAGVAGTVLVSQGTSSPLYQNTLTLAGGTAASSTNTGALQVVGGVGIGGNLYVGGDMYTAGQQVITTATVNNYANQTFLFAGTDTAISTSSGNITVWNISTLQSVTGRGATTTNGITITSSTQSTSTISGALVVTGGIGAGGNVWIGGDLDVAGTIYMQGVGLNTISGSTGTFDYLIVEGTGTGLAVTNNVTVGGNVTATSVDVATIRNINSAGTVYVDSNAGIAGTLNVTGTTTLSVVNATTGTVRQFTATNLTVTGTTTVVTINASSTATFAGTVKVGPAASYNSYQSTTATTTATISLDSFAATEYRTVKYIAQAVDTGATPNKVHVTEFLVFHDNNDVSTQAYIIQYGIGSNTGELGTWDAVYAGGIITLQFTPSYIPSALTVKTVRTAITV